MEHRDRELELAESRILELLVREQAGYTARELVERLKESGDEAISEEAIRVALWDLISEGDVEYKERTLRSSKPIAAI